jgi:hypothetical protein
VTSPRWRFGTVVRVSPTDPANRRVPQPDDRRWMVLATARALSPQKWALLFLRPSTSPNATPLISNWNTMIGFEIVEEAS